MAGSTIQDGHPSRTQTHVTSSDDTPKDGAGSASSQPKKPFFLERLWGALRLNPGMVVAMVK